MSWIMGLETRKPMVSAGFSSFTQLILMYLLGKVLPPENNKLAVNMEDLKDLGGKKRQQFPRCPAPTVQVLPAHVSPG